MFTVQSDVQLVCWALYYFASAVFMLNHELSKDTICAFCVIIVERLQLVTEKRL